MLSRIRSNLLLSAAVLGGLSLSVNSAAAQSVQDQKLLVQASIGELCSVTSASLDFGGSVNVESTTDASGTIEIACVGTTSVGVQLDGGANGQFGTRNMSNGESFIIYELYKDSARSQAWVVGDQVTQSISGTGSIPVYGRIPDQNNGHAPGLYTDEVTITLIF
jgi:spore coat protein U-like protein